jgi:hypothetical protein
MYGFDGESKEDSRACLAPCEQRRMIDKIRLSLQLISQIRPNLYIQVAILGLISLSFLNMLYCTLAYEFGWGPTTVLIGPEDRFGDVIKLSLSFRAVTAGADLTQEFKNWKPVYQRYYEQPDYGGIDAVAMGKVTHLHHPPLSTLILLATGAFIVWSGNPSGTLFLFFFIYLLEVASLIWIGIPPGRRRTGLILGIWFFCLASYPALIMFGRGNYINAGLTTVPIVLFLIAVFGRKQATILPLLALAIAVNIHPNAIIFLLALPLCFGVRRAIMPSLKFAGMAGALFGFSYVAAHKLYSEYTIATFRRGVAIYGKAYVTDGGGVTKGSSLFGMIFRLNYGLHLRTSFSGKMTTFYVLAGLALLMVLVALWRTSIWNRNNDDFGAPTIQGKELKHIRRLPESDPWPLPLIPFFLVAFYCILSPVFADYHLLVFAAPLFLAFLEPEIAQNHIRLLTVVVLTSVLLLSPKNYPLGHESVQVILNPLILYAVVVWLSIVLLRGQKRRSINDATIHVVDGR